MPHGQQEQLSELIDREDGITKLNIIRADQKNFTYTAISAEVEKALGLEGLYKFAKDFLPTLLLSKNAIRYYADIAGQYAASRLRRLDKPQQWLHALCFIYHRYQQIMDNLITSFRGPVEEPHIVNKLVADCQEQFEAKQQQARGDKLERSL